MSDTHIRPLAREDAHCLWEMLYQAIHVPQGVEPPPREIVNSPDLAHYVAGWGRAGDMGYLAVDAEGMLVGAAWLRLFPAEDPGYGYMDDATPELSVAVMSGYRGQGIGSRLLSALFDAAAERYDAVSLSVQADNPALRLYQRLGFEVIEDGGTWVTMRKQLTQSNRVGDWKSSPEAEKRPQALNGGRLSGLSTSDSGFSWKFRK